ncbi:unnamed protein product [Merluccius merluccius]
MGTETDAMLRLAAEAFHAKNYELAADIYGYQLAEPAEPAWPGTGRQELMVKRADALAFAGKLAEAFGVYRQAAEIDRLRPAHLGNLLAYLVDHTERRGVGRQKAAEEVAAAGPADDAWSCRACLGFLSEPVTLPCGHSLCRKCLKKRGETGETETEMETPVRRCEECGDASEPDDVRGYRVNVVLGGILCKWFPARWRAVELRRQGNGLHADGKTEEALGKYNEAVLMAPKDHLLFSNRSQIHSSLRHYNMALRDAEMACTLMPHWSKGHVRKAQALVSLGRSEDALKEYLVCLSLQPDCKVAKSEAQKLLGDFLAPVTDQVPDRVLDYSVLLSSRVQVKSAGMQRDAHTSAAPRAHSRQTAPMGAPRVRPVSLALCISRSLALTQAGIANLCSRLTHMDKTLINHKRQESQSQLKLLQFYSSHSLVKVSKQKTKAKRVKPVIGACHSLVGSLIDPTDLECSLCMRLFYEPVTTPCGHTFCLKCLERCLDHNPQCPLCKQELSQYLAKRSYCKTSLMESLISTYLPTDLMERHKVYHEEMAEFSNLNQNVPIFVCTMAFPTVPCPLHIFEPCYRLMIRRCMETDTKCFGMCLGDELKGFADYGCLLEIRNVEFFSDGRSVVDTIGRRRFKVNQHRQQDGYNTADIEYLEDTKVEGAAEKELQTLHNAVYDQALVWVNSLKPDQKERIVGHFGPMPEKDSDPQASPNGPPWCWWLLAVLPLEGRAQLPFLALTSLQDRLRGIRRVLLFMAHNTRHR